MAENKRVALITGANRGLGLEIARQLGVQAITVVLGARNLSKGESAAEVLRKEGIDAFAVQLDVTNSGDIEALPTFFRERFGQLDILVNNAGINLEWGPSDRPMPKPSEIDLEMLHKIYDANLFGAIAVTQTLLPLIRLSPAGRIVNQSSILGSLTLQSSPHCDFFKVLGYASSKTALNAFTVFLANELKETKIKVNSAHPGWVKTDLGTNAAPVTIEEGAKTAVWLATLPEDGPTGGFFHLERSIPW